MSLTIRQFFKAAMTDAVALGGSYAVIVNGWPVLISRTADGLFAVIDRCSHSASNLHSGRVRRGIVQCPLHGARFELSTGRCIGRVYSDILTFNVREIEGAIEVEVPEMAPGKDHMPVS